MQQYQIVKGTFDVLPYGTGLKEWQYTHQWQTIESIIYSLCKDYCIKETRTPVMENTEVFHHSVGETSDIVTKEMYTFLDKKGRSLSLRPEGTAPLVRAFVEKQMHQFDSIHKLFYIGPMFRYERMQQGRYRQFHQFGVEFLGPMHVELDAELIDLCHEFYKRLGLKNFILKINSVGSTECRINYRKKLTDYLAPHKENLSLESQERFEKNPLRILDSKDLKDQEILKQAPTILDALSSEAKKYFEQLLHIFDRQKIAYEISPKLVRGLDYYTNTVFEFQSTDLGAQNALCGGGRYDQLVHSFGGPDIPGVGFAMGMERIIETLLAQNFSFPLTTYPFVFFIPLDAKAKELCFSLITTLRHHRIASDGEWDLSKKIQKSLQRANFLQAKYAAICGEEEMKKQEIQLKNLENRTQESVKISEFVPYIQKLCALKE